LGRPRPTQIFKQLNIYIMKNIIVFLSIIFLVKNGVSQNVGVSGSYMPNPIAVGSPATLEVKFLNACFCPISTGNTYVEVTIPPNAVHTVPTALNPPTGAGAAYFNWFFDGLTWTGTNNQIIPMLSNLTINWSVTAISAGASPSVVMYVDLNLGSDPDPNNNNALAALVVQAPAPIELSSFYAKVTDCDHIDLQWETASEQNNAYMEILRSTDGKEFLSIGKVEGSNHARGSGYSLEDHNFLEPGTKYLYKIRQVDFDGTMTHHKLIAVQYDCQGAKPVMKLYPNPAKENLNITMSGIKLTQDASFNLYDGEGALVRKLFIASDKVNELSLLGLSPGMYHIKSVNLDEPVYARFIKIE
jgi:Secretion system C-terminal sorting domain